MFMFCEMLATVSFIQAILQIYGNAWLSMMKNEQDIQAIEDPTNCFTMKLLAIQRMRKQEKNI